MNTHWCRCRRIPHDPIRTSIISSKLIDNFSLVAISWRALSFLGRLLRVKRGVCAFFRRAIVETLF